MRRCGGWLGVVRQGCEGVRWRACRRAGRTRGPDPMGGGLHFSNYRSQVRKPGKRGLWRDRESRPDKVVCSTTFLPVYFEQFPRAGVFGMDMQCKICGTRFVGQGNSRYCSDECRGEGAKAYWKCPVVEKPPLPDKACPTCGTSFPADHKAKSKKYCSRKCGLRAVYLKHRKPPKERVRHPRVRRTKKPRQAQVSKPCELCGQAFGCPESLTNRRRYCSKKCREKGKSQSPLRRAIKRRSDKNQKAKRRALKRGAYVAPVKFAEIALRDGWKCQLCGKTVKRKAQVPDPLAPTMDHIIPLAKGGTHEPKNVQLAHFRCNSLKSDREIGQLRFIG
jgi:5-methylcytosine-specific restriction endonuclease McrA